MKHKISELEGALLDAAVAKAQGLALARPYFLGRAWDADAWCEDGDPQRSVFDGPDSRHPYAPSRAWQDGGPIIERERITLCGEGDFWDAYVAGKVAGNVGPTPLIAAMRAFVASRFGDEI